MEGGADGLAAGDHAGTAAALQGDGVGEGAVLTGEGVEVGVPGGGFAGAEEDGSVVGVGEAHGDLAGGDAVGALQGEAVEVGGVAVEADVGLEGELSEGEEGEPAGLRAGVRHAYGPDFDGVVGGWNEEAPGDLDAVGEVGDDGVPRAVTGLEAVGLAAGRVVADVPELAGVVVAEVEEAGVVLKGRLVAALDDVGVDTAGVAEAREARAALIHDGEVAVVEEEVLLGLRGRRGGDDVFPGVVLHAAESFHSQTSRAAAQGSRRSVLR